MKTITSKDNPIFKNALKLKQKKHRDRQEMYLLEGVKPLEDAGRLGIAADCLFVKEGTEVGGEMRAERCFVLPPKLFDQLSDTETSQGVIAQVAKHVLSPEDFFSEIPKGGNIAVLDRLQDPGNIGTIIRTAEAAGYSGLVVLPGTGDIYSPKVVRAASGSILRMPLLFAESTGELIDLLHGYGFAITVTTPVGGMDFREADMKNNIALVIGNEGRGICDELINDSDMRVQIPMKGSIESLNAAVAAAVLMYSSV